MSVNKMTIDKMSLNKMTIDKMSVNKMTLDRMTFCPRKYRHMFTFHVFVTEIMDIITLNVDVVLALKHLRWYHLKLFYKCNSDRGIVRHTFFTFSHFNPNLIFENNDTDLLRVPLR